ncbi:hypothetical protein [Actinokineospora inagensis]|uniref:hypothetical protein n=1 Tax=Actinokineospora inagensis TaxID=103730 RepID=UPI0012FBA01E|nr:hypothetical protein [Actinokineospora inagensis]
MSARTRRKNADPGSSEKVAAALLRDVIGTVCACLRLLPDHPVVIFRHRTRFITAKALHLVSEL